MVVYIRHSNDECSKDEYKHDKDLCPNAKKTIRAVATNLIEIYGVPRIIITSPFRRTIKTAEEMVKYIKHTTGNKPKIYLSNSVSRFFSKKEQANPMVTSETLKHKIPIYESWKEFKGRVNKHIDKMYRNDFYYNNDVWCITHYLVYRHVSRQFNINIPFKVPYLHHFKVKLDQNDLSDHKQDKQDNNNKNVEYHISKLNDRHNHKNRHKHNHKHHKHKHH